MPEHAGSAFVAAVLLVVNAGSVVAVALRLASRIANDAVDRALAATVLAIAQAVGVTLVLAMLGIVGRGPVTALHVSMLLATLRLVRPARTGPAGHATLPGSAAVALGAGLMVLAAAPAVRALQSAHFETRHYHITNIASWLQTGTFWKLPFENPGLFTASYPSNAEMFGLWLVLPSHGDQVAYLSMLAFGLLTVLACASIARDLGGEAAWGALCAVAFLTAPHIFRTHAYTLGTDLPAAALLAAAVALLLRHRRMQNAGWAILAGIALGLSLGTKYTALVPCAVVLVWAAVTHRLGRGFWLLVPGLVLFAAPWFIRNVIETGNPVHPQEIRLAGTVIADGAFDPRGHLSTTIANHVLNGRTSVLRTFVRLASQVWGPIILLAAGGIAGSVRRDAARLSRIAVASLAAVCAAAYAITPYSGAGPTGLPFLMTSNLRYATPAILLGVAVAAAVVPRTLRGILVTCVLVYGAIRIAEGTVQRPDLALRPWIVATAVVVAAVAYLVARRPSPPKASRVVVAAVASAALLGAWGVVWRGVRYVRPAPLDVAVHRITAEGPVVVLGVGDLRSILGTGLETRMTTLISSGSAATRRPFADPAELSAALERSPWNMVAFRNIEGLASVPPGWTPPSTWRLVASTPSGHLWVRSTPR